MLLRLQMSDMQSTDWQYSQLDSEFPFKIDGLFLAI